MDWILTFTDISKFVSDKFDVEINLFEDIPKDFLHEGFSFNGAVFFDERIIDLYGNLDTQPTELICVLIHELGHMIASSTLGVDHSEYDAWEIGRYFIEKESKDFIPPNFDSVMGKCLESYDY